MSNIAPISGVGKNAKRTDRGMVQKIQRNAKIQNASGGAYGQRAEMQSIASGAATGTTASAVSAQLPQGNSLAASVQSIGAFAPGQQDVPLSEGSPYGPGAGAEVLQTPADSIDQGGILARAMYAMNPTPQLRRIVEAYNEMGI